jgi:hypothetical protein
MRPAVAPHRDMGNFPGRFQAEDSSGTCPAYRAWDGLKGRRRRAASPGGPPTQRIRYSRYIRRRRTHPPPAGHRRQGNRNPCVFRRVSAELFGGKSHRALSPGTWLSLMTTALVSVAFPGPPHHLASPPSEQPDGGHPPPLTALPRVPPSERLLLRPSPLPQQLPQLARHLAKSRMVPVPTWELAPAPAQPESWLRVPRAWGADPVRVLERARRGQLPSGQVRNS